VTATTFPYQVSARAPSAMSVPAHSAPATSVPPNLHLQSGPSQVAHQLAAASLQPPPPSEKDIRALQKTLVDVFGKNRMKNVLYKGSTLSVTESQALISKIGSAEEFGRVLELIRYVFTSESGNPIQKPKTKKKTNERKKENSSQESAMEVFKRSEPEKAAIERPNRSASEKNASPLTVAGLNRNNLSKSAKSTESKNATDESSKNESDESDSINSPIYQVLDLVSVGYDEKEEILKAYVVWEDYNPLTESTWEPLDDFMSNEFWSK
jgi:hypothetical protein